MEKAAWLDGWMDDRWRSSGGELVLYRYAVILLLTGGILVSLLGVNYIGEMAENGKMAEV